MLDRGQSYLQLRRLRAPLIPWQLQTRQSQTGYPELQRQEECMEQDGQSQRQRQPRSSRIILRACADFAKCNHLS